MLVNGNPAGYFAASRGINQEDPLSPYLFLLISEAMTRRLNYLTQTGVIASFGLPVESFQISHLSYADDLIVFTKGLKRSLENLKEFLAQYEAASGLQVSNQKSFFLATNKRPESYLKMV